MKIQQGEAPKLLPPGDRSLLRQPGDENVGESWSPGYVQRHLPTENSNQTIWTQTGELYGGFHRYRGTISGSELYSYTRE